MHSRKVNDFLVFEFGSIHLLVLYAHSNANCLLRHSWLSMPSLDIDIYGLYYFVSWYIYTCNKVGTARHKKFNAAEQTNVYAEVHSNRAWYSGNFPFSVV